MELISFLWLITFKKKQKNHDTLNWEAELGAVFRAHDLSCMYVSLHFLWMYRELASILIRHYNIITLVNFVCLFCFCFYGFWDQWWWFCIWLNCFLFDQKNYLDVYRFESWGTSTIPTYVPGQQVCYWPSHHELHLSFPIAY